VVATLHRGGHGYSGAPNKDTGWSNRSQPHVEFSLFLHFSRFQAVRIPGRGFGGSKNFILKKKMFWRNPLLSQFKKNSIIMKSRSRWFILGIGIAGIGLVGAKKEEIKPYFKCLKRTANIIKTSAVIAADYYINFPSSAPPEIVKETAQTSLDAQISKSDGEIILLKSEIHERSARRLLSTFKDNGGIYVKLGQLLASLVYLLPPEYTATLSELHDACSPSPTTELKCLVESELGPGSLENLFEDFEWDKVLGVASLAQAHKAKWKLTGESVAVKIQHPSLSSVSGKILIRFELFS
jgi:hypothetical protein